MIMMGRWKLGTLIVYLCPVIFTWTVVINRAVLVVLRSLNLDQVLIHFYGLMRKACAM